VNRNTKCEMKQR